MKRSPWRKAVVLACVSALVYSLSHIAQSYPEMVEKLYSSGIYRVYAQIFSSITGLLPVSVSELLLLIGFPVGLTTSIVRWVRRRIDWKRFVSGWLTVVLTLVLLFYAGWGFNYARLPYARIAGLETAPVEVDKVEELVVQLAQQANDLREQVKEGDEAFVLEGTQRDVMKLVNDAYENAAQERPWLAGSFGTPKLAVLSTSLAYLNIAGIFSPFTMEAHVDAREADVMLAATAMHEAAHLRGFAREDEANYIAYMVCMESDDAYVRYSGTLLGLIYAGNALAGADRDRYAQVHSTYSPGVLADLRAYSENWQPYQGKAAEVHEQVNDAYLKANHQQDGVKSYGRMIDLMIAQMEKDKEE